MNDSINNVEDQPEPPADEAAVAELNSRMQDAVNKLGQALVRKFQMNGNQFNALDLEMKVLLLVESMQIVISLIVQLSGGKHTDATITETMIARVTALIQAIDPANAPRVAVASGMPPPRFNGRRAN
jgi:hypothetical protein